MTRAEALSIFGLSEGYTEDELKKSYKRLVRKHHPDIAGVGSTALFVKIQSAYELLSFLPSSRADMLLTHNSVFTIVRN